MKSYLKFILPPTERHSGLFPLVGAAIVGFGSMWFATKAPHTFTRAALFLGIGSGLLTLVALTVTLGIRKWLPFIEKEKRDKPHWAVRLSGIRFLTWFLAHNSLWVSLGSVLVSGLLFALGPQPWLLFFTAGLSGGVAYAFFGLLSVLGYLVTKGYAVLGLCWPSAIPVDLTNLWVRAAETLFLGQRFHQALKHDKDAGNTLFRRLVSILDLEKVGGAERGVLISESRATSFRRELVNRGTVLLGISLLTLLLTTLFSPAIRWIAFPVPPVTSIAFDPTVPQPPDTIAPSVTEVTTEIPDQGDPGESSQKTSEEGQSATEGDQSENLAGQDQDSSQNEGGESQEAGEQSGQTQDTGQENQNGVGTENTDQGADQSGDSPNGSQQEQDQGEQNGNQGESSNQSQGEDQQGGNQEDGQEQGDPSQGENEAGEQGGDQEAGQEGGNQQETGQENQGGDSQQNTQDSGSQSSGEQGAGGSGDSQQQSPGESGEQNQGEGNDTGGENTVSAEGSEGQPGSSGSGDTGGEQEGSTGLGNQNSGQQNTGEQPNGQGPDDGRGGLGSEGDSGTDSTDEELSAEGETQNETSPYGEQEGTGLPPPSFLPPSSSAIVELPLDELVPRYGESEDETTPEEAIQTPSNSNEQDPASFPPSIPAVPRQYIPNWIRAIFYR